MHKSMCLALFNVLVHCVLQGSSLCTLSILAQGLSFVRLHFLFLSAQTRVCFGDISGMHWHWFVAFASCHTCIFRVSYAFHLIHGHRAFPGDMDGATVSVLSLEQLITALLLIVNELCHRFRILYLQHHLYHWIPHQIWKILQGHQSPHVALVVRSVAGVILPVDVRSLVIQGIVVIHIGIGVMDNFLDEWSLVQSGEGSWDTSSVISPPLQFRPKSAPLQREPLPQGPRLVSPFQVSDLHPVASSSIGCLGQSSAQRHSGIPRVSDLSHGCQFLPLNSCLSIRFELFLGSTRCRFPHRIYPWFRAGRLCNRTLNCLSLKDVWVIQIRYR